MPACTGTWLKVVAVVGGGGHVDAGQVQAGDIDPVGAGRGVLDRRERGVDVPAGSPDPADRVGLTGISQRAGTGTGPAELGWRQ